MTTFSGSRIKPPCSSTAHSGDEKKLDVVDVFVAPADQPYFVSFEPRDPCYRMETKMDDK